MGWGCLGLGLLVQVKGINTRVYKDIFCSSMIQHDLCALSEVNKDTVSCGGTPVAYTEA